MAKPSLFSGGYGAITQKRDSAKINLNLNTKKREQMLKKYLIMVSLIFTLFILLSVPTIAVVTPPSLTDYMQIYGKITNYVISSGDDLKVQVGENKENSFSAFVKKDGTYGSNPTLKITGKEGDKLSFSLNNKPLNVSEAYTYQNKAVKEINLAMSCISANKATWVRTEGSCINKQKTVTYTCEGKTDTKNEDCCEPSWGNCTEWSGCDGSKKTRTCSDANKCDAKALTKTETESCGQSGYTGSSCTEKWSCGTWSSCNAQLKKVRTCVDTNDCKGDKTEELPCDKCEESWICTSYSACIGGKRIRSCTDEHSCGTIIFKPKITETCLVKETIKSVPAYEDIAPEEEYPVKKDTCFDGIQNQNEKKADCGGVCKPCAETSMLLYYYIGGGIVLLVIIVLAVLFFLKRRGAAEIDAESMEKLSRAYSGGESRGMSEDEITEKMVESGWDKKILKAFLKQR